MGRPTDIGSAIGGFVRRLSPSAVATVDRLCDLLGTLDLKPTEPRTVAALAALNAACALRKPRRKGA